MIRPVLRSASLAAALALAAAAAGCGVSRQENVFLAPRTEVLFGRVQRGGAAVPGQLVKLYDDLETVLYDSTRTDPDGQYGFAAAPAGGVMVKVSSLLPGDFGYVRYLLTRSDAAERDSVPPLDLDARGCHALAPAPDDTVPVPDPGAPLDFTWTAMSAADPVKYRARLATPDDSTLWESPRDVGTSSTFNGIATQGSLAGTLVPPGAYRWRVKVRFPNGVSAATVPQALWFASPAGVQP